MYFCHFPNNIGFSYEGKGYKIKFRFNVYKFQDPLLCSSTITGSKQKSILMVEVHDKTAAFWQGRMEYLYTGVYSVHS